MHVTPPTGPGNVIIASSIGRIGKAGDPDDMAVIATGTTRVEMDRGNKRIEVELALLDVGGETVGALGLVWRYPVGGNHAEFERTAVKIRDALSRRILNAANLMDPYPFVPLVTTKSRAQSLVDEALLRHPEVTVLALRGREQGSDQLVLLGSTFGRHGKKADSDDLKVLENANPTTGVYSNGKRFGVDMALRDRAGNAIGTMNVGYAYRNADDGEGRSSRRRWPCATSCRRASPRRRGSTSSIHDRARARGDAPGVGRRGRADRRLRASSPRRPRRAPRPARVTSRPCRASATRRWAR